MNFEHPIRLGNKFEITQIEPTVSTVTAQVSSTEQEKEPTTKKKKGPSKGLKLGKKKHEEEDY